MSHIQLNETDISKRHVCICLFVFFFSSRRRHTRWTGDWSSDVCSSDLTIAIAAAKSIGSMRRASASQIRPSNAPRFNSIALVVAGTRHFLRGAGLGLAEDRKSVV